MLKIWTCKYCNKQLELKNKHTKSGHLAKCPDWYKFRDENLNQDNLYKLYVVERKSLPDIAKLFNLESVTSVVKQLNKFGLKTRSTAESFPLADIKRAQTNIERYGSANVLGKNSPIRLEMEAEHLHKYGVINFGQLEAVKKKIIETFSKKYEEGHPSRNPIVQQKTKDTLFANFGVTYPYQVQSPIRRNKYTKIHKKLVEALQEEGILVNIEKCLKFDKKIYFFDIWFNDNNLLIEVNGDYFHANPIKYKPDFLIPIKKKTAQEIWDYDALKIKRATDAGYTVLVVWESEIKSLTGLSIIKQKILDELEKFKQE